MPPIGDSTQCRQSRVDGDAQLGTVQVLLPTPDDAQAHVLFKSVGVQFYAVGSLQATTGVITMHKQPNGDLYAYRWRY